MTNPFGGFGGQQSVFGTGGQQQQTSPFAGSAAPVFGQAAFGQPTPTATSTFTSNVFGQNASQSSPQAGLFSSQTTSSAASTAASSSVFGKPSVFGQNVSQTNTQLGVFSNQADNSSSEAGKSAFGQVSLFGQSTTAKNVFGSPTFGAATSGTPVSTAPSAGLFTSMTSSQSTLPSPSLFGGLKSQSGTFSSTGRQSSSPFGGAGSTNTGSTSAGAFSHPPVSSSSLFSKPSSTASAFTASTGFAVKKEPGIESKAGIFGGQGTSIKPETKTLFGKVYVKEERTTDYTESKPVRSSVFGGANIKQEDGGVVKTEPFGKQTSAEGSKKSAGLFGKGKKSTQMLFGKVAAKTEDFKQPDNEPEESGEQYSSRESSTQDVRTTSSRGLFGKPAATSSEGKTASSMRLFGKSPVSSRTRIPSSSEDARPLVRRQMSEEIGSKLAIVCKNIPHKYNNTMTLKSHFKRYGDVTKVFPNQAKMQATIHFKTHSDAAEAKRRGRTLAVGIAPMTIFWSSYAGPGTPKVAKPTSSMEPRTGRSLKRTSDTELVPQSKRTTIKSEDPLHEELAGMVGTSDIRGHTREPKRSPERRSRAVSPTPSTSSTSLDTKNVQSQMFQGAMARTTTERAQMLELRDKFIRQNQVKQKKDIETAKAFVGTCPDMCPEKERYDREDKRRLSYYEIVPGTEHIPGKNPQVDHRRAVKEYLRSSPDQDEPLPHELRPTQVLLSTMTYLLCEVADRGEDGRWGDWFDFLWNRMRGIRKDITQQQLNDRYAVELIEKCARFHIFCSERLCEEDMHSFDAKINNENLTKCLQTLKEFYADLEKKHQYFCENEAEFRGYMVLMNLNEGDTLREVQQLRPVVRTSRPVKFALQTYFALNGNNYIKFFRLVKQASFNNAFIMHRYFTQVRNKAITTMMKGYSTGSRPAQIPLTELVRLLGFESEEEASDFCQHYGFNISDGEVVLDRSEYIEPETAWLPRRSVNLIESRLMVSVGELMNGKAFGNVQHLNPVSSFDENDKFWSSISLPKKDTAPEPRGASVRPVEERPTLVEVKQEPVPVVTQQEEAKQKAKVSVEVLKDTAKFLFWDVIDGMCQEIGQEVRSEVNDKLVFSEDYMHELLNRVLLEDMSDVIKEVLDEAHALRCKQLQEELEARRERVAMELTDEVIYDLVWQEAMNLSTIKMREVKAQLKQECIDRTTADINDELVDDVMNEIVADVSEDVFETDVRQRLKQLDDFEKIVKLSRARRFWECWKKEFNTLVKLKRGMEEFPSAPNMQSNKGVLKSLIPVEDERIVGKKFYVGKRARLTIESPLEIEARHKQTATYVMVHDLYSKLKYQSAWSPLDLGKLVGKQLSRQHKSSPSQSAKKIETMSWKLLLCLPDYDDGSLTTQSALVNRTLCKWLKAKLSKGMTPPAVQSSINSEVLSLYKCYISDETSSYTSRPAGLNVCVRTVQGTLDTDDIAAVEEEMLLMGTNALMFVLPAGTRLDQPKSVEYRQYWHAQFSRLKSILLVKPMCQSFPLVVLIPTSANEKVCFKQVEDGLKFHELTDLVCDVELLIYDTDSKLPEGIDLVNPSVSERLCKSVQWLAGNTQLVPKLEVKFFKDVINDVLQKYYFSPTQQNLKKRKLLNSLEKDPGSLLELYDNVVTHIGLTLTSDTLCTISWPVYEYTDAFSTATPLCHWNKGDHLEYVYGLVQSLKLPEFPPLPSISEDWEEVTTAIWNFVSSFADNDSSVARVILFSRLKKLLHNLEVDFEEACNFQYGEMECRPTCYNIPWTTVISMCVDYKLDSIDLIDPDSNLEEGGQELKVAYIKEEMEKFVVPEMWKYVESDADIHDTPCLDDTIHSAVLKSRKMKDNPQMEIAIEDDPSNVSVVAMETWKTADSLKEALRTERRRSDHFMKYLENALQDGEMDSSVTSVSSVSVFEPASVFEPSKDRRLSLPPTRRKSDVDIFDLSQLPPGKRRRSRLSEVFSNDPVLMYINEPSLTEDLDNLKDSVRSERRQSDLFTQRLQLIMQDEPDCF